MSLVINFPDPNFPFIQLPTQFRAQRHTMVDRQATLGETKEVFRAQGPVVSGIFGFPPIRPTARVLPKILKTIPTPTPSSRFTSMTNHGR